MHAVAWLRRYYKCRIILSEQYCATDKRRNQHNRCPGEQRRALLRRSDRTRWTRWRFRPQHTARTGERHRTRTRQSRPARRRLPSHWLLLSRAARRSCAQCSRNSLLVQPFHRKHDRSDPMSKYCHRL
jgi:hypothetical protein